LNPNKIYLVQTNTTVGVLIVTIGKSTFGKRADGILLKLIQPKNTNVKTYISVVMGLLIANLYIALPYFAGTII
jgi:hypothetical protein